VDALSTSAGYGNGISIPEAVATAKALRKTNVNLVNWQPLVGTVQFDPLPGIAAGVQRTMFLDRLGESANSGVDPAGVGQTEADGTLFGGKVSTGQMILIQSLGISVGGGAGTGLAAGDVDLFGACSVQLNLRGRPIDMGSILDWPEIAGVTAVPANGRQIVGEYRFDTPHLLEPLDDFTLRFRFENAVVMSGVGPFLVRAYFGATRVYDERVLAVS